MKFAARKRYHAGRDEYVTGSHPPSYEKKMRTFGTQPTAHCVSASRKGYTRDEFFRRHEVSNPESEEVEEEEEEMEEKIAQLCSQETEGEEESAMPLVVFQCNTCRSIFGDSYAFVCSTEQLWLVTLSHVTNVSLAPEVQTANKGPDAGSSYYELLCQNCQAVLGRKYLTTPVALDGIRDLFSFSTEAMTSYTLGDPMEQAEGTVSQTMHEAAEACHRAVKKLAADSNEVVKLRDEMEKVKGLMLTVDERLAQLEEVNFESSRTKG